MKDFIVCELCFEEVPFLIPLFNSNINEGYIEVCPSCSYKLSNKI